LLVYACIRGFKNFIQNTKNSQNQTAIDKLFS